MRLRGSQLAAYVVPFLLLAVPLDGRASGAAADSITIDARTASLVPHPSSYHGGTLSSSSGHTIGINSMYLTMDKRPWLPVMGEFHYSRVPEDGVGRRTSQDEVCGRADHIHICHLDSSRGD